MTHGKRINTGRSKVEKEKDMRSTRHSVNTVNYNEDNLASAQHGSEGEQETSDIVVAGQRVRSRTRVQYWLHVKLQSSQWMPITGN